MPNGEEQPEEAPVEIILEPDKMAGVWANYARVGHSEHEFTLDFIRIGNPTAARYRCCQGFGITAVHHAADRCPECQLAEVRRQGDAKGGSRR